MIPQRSMTITQDDQLLRYSFCLRKKSRLIPSQPRCSSIFTHGQHNVYIPIYTQHLGKKWGKVPLARSAAAISSDSHFPSVSAPLRESSSVRVPSGITRNPEAPRVARVPFISHPSVPVSFRMLCRRLVYKDSSRVYDLLKKLKGRLFCWCLSFFGSLICMCIRMSERKFKIMGTRGVIICFVVGIYTARGVSINIL